MAEEVAQEKPIVVVFTGNSNTGLATVHSLIDQCGDSITIRAVVRKKSRAGELKDLPIEIVNADINQPSLLKAVFQGNVNTAFWSTPNEPNRVELTKKFIDTCIAYGVDFPVIVSLLSADNKETEFQKQFSEIEEYCKAKAGTPVKRQMLDTGKQVLQPIILRCALFYQNFFGSVAGIQSGSLYYPLGNEGVIPHVDINDVGKCAATIMSNPAPHGDKTYNLIGEYQAGNQLASAIVMASRIGCAYEDVDDEVALEAFKALGLADWYCQGFVETLAWYRGLRGQDIASDIPSILGKPATRFTTFVKKEMSSLLKGQ